MQSADRSPCSNEVGTRSRVGSRAESHEKFRRSAVDAAASRRSVAREVERSGRHGRSIWTALSPMTPSSDFTDHLQRRVVPRASPTVTVDAGADPRGWTARQTGCAPAPLRRQGHPRSHRPFRREHRRRARHCRGPPSARRRGELVVVQSPQAVRGDFVRNPREGAGPVSPPSTTATVWSTRTQTVSS